MVASWAMEESAAVDFGDERLDARMGLTLSALGTRPNLSIPAACGGRAEMTGAYRFFDNQKVTFDKVLAPHVACTMQRLQGQSVVLLVQDTTEIDLTRPEQAVAGAGTLDGVRTGLLLHDMQAFLPDGTPLGTAWAQVLNRTDGVKNVARLKRRERAAAPIEQKESVRWLAGLREARQIAGRLPDVTCVCVADSEADIYELLAEPRDRPNLHYLIRAAQDRAVHAADGGPQASLRQSLLAAPVLYEVDLLVRGRKALTSQENRRRRSPRQNRKARVEVRALALTLRPPWRKDRTFAPVDVKGVLVRESNPPAGEEAIEWILVTSLPIDAATEVRTLVDYYCVRWGIEILFRTLKSGCRIEQRRFEHVDRVLPCLAMYLIVAWRTLFVCHRGRACPELDCQAIFEACEWKAVWATVRGEKPPQKPPSLAQMIHLIARLGGYIERPGSEPGAQTVWIGLQRMHDLAWAWEQFGPGSEVRDR